MPGPLRLFKRSRLQKQPEVRRQPKVPKQPEVRGQPKVPKQPEVRGQPKVRESPKARSHFAKCLCLLSAHKRLYLVLYHKYTRIKTGGFVKYFVLLLEKVPVFPAIRLLDKKRPVSPLTNRLRGL